MDPKAWQANESRDNAILVGQLLIGFVGDGAQGGAGFGASVRKCTLVGRSGRSSGSTGGRARSRVLTMKGALRVPFWIGLQFQWLLLVALLFGLLLGLQLCLLLGRRLAFGSSTCSTG